MEKNEWGGLLKRIFMACYVFLIGMMAYSVMVRHVWHYYFLYVFGAIMIVLLMWLSMIKEKKGYALTRTALFVFFLLTMLLLIFLCDMPGVRYIEADHVLVRQPSPEHSEDYVEEYWNNGLVYKGMTNKFEYGKGKEQRCERKYHGLGTLFAEDSTWRVEARWDEGVSSEGTVYDASGRVIYQGGMKFDNLVKMAIFAEQKLRDARDGVEPMDMNITANGRTVN